MSSTASNMYLFLNRVRNILLFNLVCYLCFSLTPSNLFNAAYIYAQQDSNTNRVLVNPNINLNTTPREGLRNVEDLRFFPQERNQVKIRTSRDSVQVGDFIDLYASLRFEDTTASYRFYLEDSEWNYNVQGEVITARFFQFHSAGSYAFGVEVKVAGLNEFLRDTIRIEVDSIDIYVQPKEIDIGEEVIFNVEFSTFSENSKYRFFYGNNIPPSEWKYQPESSYIYELPGTYSVYAEEGRFDGDEPYLIFKSKTKQVSVNQEYIVELEADKDIAAVGEEIIFTAYSNTAREDVEYLFYLEGARRTGSPRQNSISHMFNEPGNYTIRVELLTARDQLLASASTEIKISVPAPPEDSFPDWLLYMFIGIGSALIGSASLKWYFKPNVTLHPNIDLGRQSFSNDKDLSIDLKLRIKFDLFNSKYHIDTKEKKLISSIRRV